MEHFGVTGTVRASLSFYNTEAEIDALVRGIRLVQETFA
jgi:cysteine desulfurase/selenocysteine lyase